MTNYGSLRYNADFDVYEALVEDGKMLCVGGDTYAEAEQDAIKQGISSEVYEAELSSPSTWESCVDDESVYYVRDRN